MPEWILLPSPCKGMEPTGRRASAVGLNIELNKAICVTLHSKTTTCLSSVNYLITKKVNDCNIGNAINVNKLATGDLLVQTFNLSQVKSLLKLRFIHDIKIEAFITVSKKLCEGIASHRDFVDMDETEIIDFMTEQNVINVGKITKNV